jgi:hypothetical protein
MSIGQTNIKYDTLEIHIISPDGGNFKLAMLYPEWTDPEKKFHKTGEIRAGGSAGDLQHAIKDFYRR